MSTYDAVVIGSGLGGLSTALMLAKNGMKTIVLEKNRQAGGALQIFSRDKAIIDTGVHYLGGLAPGQVLERYFSYFGIYDKLKIERLDRDCFDIVSLPSGDFGYAQGFEEFTKRMANYFPHEKNGIKKYVTALQEVTAFFPVYNVEPGLVNPLENPWMGITAKNWIASFVSDPLLQHVLAGTHMLYEGRAESTPAYVHAMTVASYIQSAWRMVDGGGQIPRYLVDEIRKFGGEFKNYADVTSLSVSNGKVTVAHTRTGEVIQGKLFISGIHPAQLYALLPKDAVRQSYVRRIASLPNTMGSFTAHCIMKPGTFGYRNHNIYGFREDNVWKASQYTEREWPASFAAFFTRRSGDENHTECANIMTLMRFDEVKEWAGTYRTYPHNTISRGKAYEDWKEQKIETLIHAAEEKMPGFKESVQSVYTSTPLSYRDYLGTADGSMYGILKDARNPLNTVFSPHSKLPNLYLTGQNLNLHGIVGTTLSAVITAGQILGNDFLMGEIKRSI